MQEKVIGWKPGGERYEFKLSCVQNKKGKDIKPKKKYLVYTNLYCKAQRNRCFIEYF